jgi:thiosulfate reductase cytochrome b subunit
LFWSIAAAPSIHFNCASLLVALLVIHLVEVVVAGAWSEIRSMITGKFVVPPGPRRRTRTCGEHAK